MKNLLDFLAQTKVDSVGETVEPVRVFCAIFGLSALAGISLVVSDKRKECSVRALLGSFMVSGIIGLVIGLIWWSKFGNTDLYFLIGVSMLAGMGGNSTLGLLYIIFIRKLGLEGLLKQMAKNDDENRDI